MNDSRRAPVGPLIAAMAGLLLLVSLFLDWYDDYTAWTIFEVLDLVLAGTAIASLVMLLRELGIGPVRAGIIGGGALLPIAAIAVVVVLSQLLNHPPAADDFSKSGGIWLALGASIVMLAGAVLATTHISLALDTEPRRGGEQPPPGGTEQPPPGTPPGRPGTADPDAPTVAREDRPEGPPP